jgi:2,3-bisphosphoglycerate-dependent phosphoglycerate mutase
MKTIDDVVVAGRRVLVRADLNVPLRDVTARLLPYWYDSIVPGLRPGATVLVVSHGNTLRTLVKHLDGIGDDEIAALNIPHGVPLVYELGPGMRPLSAGRYL